MAALRAGLPKLIPGHQRRRSGRRPFPDHLPRDRIMIPGPSARLCRAQRASPSLVRASRRRRSVVPRRLNVIQNVRGKFTCRGARRSTRLQRRFMWWPLAIRGQTCWRWFCMPSSRCTSRSTAKARPGRAKVSIASAPAPPFLPRSPNSFASMGWRRRVSMAMTRRYLCSLKEDGLGQLMGSWMFTRQSTDLDQSPKPLAEATPVATSLYLPTLREGPVAQLGRRRVAPP